MPIYAYKGLNAKGSKVNGVLDSENPKTLRADLRKRQVFLTEYSEQSKEGKSKRVIQATGAKQAGSRDVEIRLFTKIPLTTVAEMTRQLATLLKSGVPLVDSLGAVAEQSEDERLARVMTQVRRSVNEGMALHLSLQDHPKVFPRLYINMVKAGETSGTLDLVFLRLADFIEGQVRLRSQVTTAMMYPTIMITLAVIIVSGLMTFVVPKLVSVIEEQGGELPLITRALIATSNAFRSYFILVVLLVGLLIYAFRRWTATEEGGLRWDTFKLRIPLFGDLFRKIIMARFANTLGTLMGAGVPLLGALDIAKNVVENALYERVIEDARVAIRDGDSIAGPLKRSGHFPPMVTQMIAVGEKTGEVEEMLASMLPLLTLNETYRR